MLTASRTVSQRQNTSSRWSATFRRQLILAVALYQAGDARLALKEHEAAYRNFNALSRVSELGELEERAALRLGECAALTSRWKESEEVFAAFVERRSASKHLNRALFGRGWAMENQGRHKDAIEAYRSVLERGAFDESSARSQFQIGECLFSMKEYEEAVKALLKVEVVYAYPKWSSKALLECGRAFEKLGKDEDAAARYRELIKKYADSNAATLARQKLEKIEAKVPTPTSRAVVHAKSI